MKILFLSRWYPFPPDNGSKLRVYHLLSGLSEFHDVTLLSFVDAEKLDTLDLEQAQFCSKIEIVPWKKYEPTSLKAIFGFFSSTPRSILDTYSKQMEFLIRETLGMQRYDLVIASQLSMAAYNQQFNGCTALFEEIELGIFFDPARSPQNILKRIRHGLTRYKLIRYLVKLLKSYKACTIVSDQEYKLLSQEFPEIKDKFVIIPNCVNLDNYSDIKVKEKPFTLIFTGSFHYHTNYEAMVWFVGQVFPKILEIFPETKLIISGDHANLPLPSTQNIILPGYVDDITSLIASATVSIAPLLSGGGTRLKILEAMAVGKPVVATSKGAEGLDVESGVHLLIADSPTAFANGVINVLKDAHLRLNLATHARQLVKEKYDWSVVLPRFLRLVDSVSGG